MAFRHLRREIPKNYPYIARRIVARKFDYDVDDVFVVWFCYILGNFKALVSTTKKDEKYFEVTFDTLKERVYVDEYRKTNQVVLKRSR